MKQIVLFDLDDTLSKSKEPQEENMSIIFSELLSKTKAGIVSGANFSQIESQFIHGLLPNTNLDNLYCFAQNAASCYRRTDGIFTEVYSFLFTNEEAAHIIKVVEDLILETSIVKDDPSFGPRVENRGAQITFSALGQHAPGDLKKTWDPDQAKRKEFRDLLLAKLEGVDIGIGGGTSIDITKKGINKTYAVKWLHESLGIPLEEMMYVGDALFPGGNDSVIISTGIETLSTNGPDETVEIIKKMLKESA